MEWQVWENEQERNKNAPPPTGDNLFVVSTCQAFLDNKMTSLTPQTKIKKCLSTDAILTTAAVSSSSGVVPVAPPPPPSPSLVVAAVK